MERKKKVWEVPFRGKRDGKMSEGEGEGGGGGGGEQGGNAEEQKQQERQPTFKSALKPARLRFGT